MYNFSGEGDYYNDSENRETHLAIISEKAAKLKIESNYNQAVRSLFSNLRS